MNRLYIALYTTLVLYAIVLSTLYNPIWIIVMISAGLAYGVLSAIVAVRRLYFLAAASPHVALLAIALAIPTASFFGGYELLYAIAYSIIVIYTAGYLIRKGIDANIATSVIVGFTASLSILVVYYVLSSYPIEFSLSAIIMGDPLLASWDEAVVALLLAISVAILTLLTYREQVSLGVDRDMARLVGVNDKVYDVLAYTLLGLCTVGLLRVVGYILVHVLVLLPPSIAVIRGRSAWDTVNLSILVAVTASLTGLHMGVLLDLSPTGLTGLALVIMYIVALVRHKK